MINNSWKIALFLLLALVTLSGSRVYAQTLPSGWTDGDIGTVGAAGSATYSNGLFTVKGAGNGLQYQSTTDSFNLAYQSLTGDGTIIARVISTDTSYAQLGVMIRDTLSPGAAYAFMDYTNRPPPYGLYLLFDRPSTGAAATENYPSGFTITTIPYWIELVRQGSTFTAYTSLEGDNWVEFYSQTLTLGNSVYIGLAVSSNNTAAVATATFDNVSISSSSTSAPAITSMTATSGTVGTQFSISGTGFGASQGSSKVLLNDAPLTVNSWGASTISVTLPTGASSGYVVVAVAPSMNASNAETFTVTSQYLPAGWLDDDINEVGIEGSATYSNNVFTVNGAGAGFDNGNSTTSDSFNFMYQSLNGDGTIVARVASTSGEQVGVMVRATLDPGATNEFEYYYPGYPSNQIVLLSRSTPGTNDDTITSTLPYVSIPYWLKMVRSGTNLSAYTSLDGNNWTQLEWSRAFAMPQSVYIGLGASSRNTTTLSTTTFDNVSINSAADPAPSISGLSTTTGPAGTRVTITGSGFASSQGNSKVFLNNISVTINSWSSTSISITIPTGATSGYLVVSLAPSMNDSNPAIFTVTSQPLSAGWLDQDIGAVGTVGSASLSGSVFTVSGAGNGVGSTSDGFHFVYQPLTTNGTITARVVTAPVSAQAGVMIRENLTTSSANAFTYFINNGGGGDYVDFSYRSLLGGATSQVNTAGVTSPYWVRLTRAANQFSSYSSPDGTHWTQVGTTQTFVTAEQVYVGLAVSSQNINATATATFDNVSISAGTTLPNPIITGISPSSGAPGATVTITGNNFGSPQGTSSVTFNGVPVTSVISWAVGSIQVAVPNGASNGPVDVVEGNITAQGPTFTLAFTAQVTDSLRNQSTYTSQVFGSNWFTVSGQGSGCSTCSWRGNTTNQADGNGNIFTSTDPLGYIAFTEYDTNNNLLSQSSQLNTGATATTAYTYNSFGEVLTMTDALNNVTTNTYDTHGDLTSVSTPPPNGSTPASLTQFGYNTLGELTTITDPLNNVTTLTYYATGLINTIEDAQSNITTYNYDTHGNRTSVKDANNQTTSFAYDTGERLTKITYPDTTTLQFAYDYRGRRHTVTDQNNNITTYNYDDADRLTSVVDAANNTTTYGYDTESNLTSIEDTNHNTTSFTYDAYGRVTKATFPSGKIETYGYDADNNLTSKIDRKNQQITYVYDALNRLTNKEYPDSTQVEYTYDLVGKILSVNDPTGTYGFSYDNMGRLIGTSASYSFLTSRTFTNAYTYDAASNRTGFTDPENGATSYVYDTLNRLETLTPPTAYGTGNFGFTYDVLSRRKTLTRPNSVTTTYTYDNESRLLTALHQLSGSTIDGAAYTLDNAGNRTAKTDKRTGVTTNYGYDAIYELKTAMQGTNTTESYTYDAVGNRLTDLGSAAWTYNTSNELTARPGSISYTYDANGNTQTEVTSAGTTTFNWDFENRLTSVVLPGSGGTVSFKYDPFGRRIYKSSSSTTSVYAYDGDNLAEETNSSGTAVARYEQTADNLDEPLAMLRSSTTSYYNADALGSITSLSSTAGSLAQTYAYDSFGRQTSSSGSLTNPFQYTAREFDSETSLYYYRARYYDAAIGRFSSEDMERFNAGVNFYQYALGSPINWVDPLGLDVTVKLYPAANPYGHIGIGVNTLNTEGFYPNHDLPTYPGQILPDKAQPIKCLIIHTTPQQDQKIQNYINSRKKNPGWWRFPGRDCSNFVHDALKAGGINVGDSSLPPKVWSNLTQLPHESCYNVTPLL